MCEGLIREERQYAVCVRVGISSSGLRPVCRKGAVVAPSPVHSSNPASLKKLSSPLPVFMMPLMRSSLFLLAE